MAGPSTEPPPPPNDFQQNFGFVSRLRTATAREIASITRSNFRNRLVAGVFGSFFVFFALESFSTSSDRVDSPYWRVYRCNFAMMIPSRRIAAVRRYLDDDIKGVAKVNWYYHLHLIRRLSDLCEREEARSRTHGRPLIVSFTEVTNVLGDLCRLYKNSKGVHIHEELLKTLKCVSRMIHRGAECDWPSLWEVVRFLLVNDSKDRAEVLYCAQLCLEAKQEGRKPPPKEMIEEVVNAAKEENGEVVVQAAKDALTLLLLKHRQCLSFISPPQLSGDPQSLFLLRHWPTSAG